MWRQTETDVWYWTGGMKYVMKYVIRSCIPSQYVIILKNVASASYHNKCNVKAQFVPFCTFVITPMNTLFYLTGFRLWIKQKCVLMYSHWWTDEANELNKTLILKCLLIKHFQAWNFHLFTNRCQHCVGQQKWLENNLTDNIHMYFLLFAIILNYL